MSQDKKILIVIAHRDFRDEEYFIPLEIFQQAGFEVTTASSRTGTAMGVLGGEAEGTLNRREAKAADFDAIVLVGGNGAQEYFDDEILHALIKDFADSGKIVAAICIAPVILAKAGVLKGKTATVWQSALDKTGPKALEEAGCSVSEDLVMVSGNIITANGREAAEAFARTVLEKLSETA